MDRCDTHVQRTIRSNDNPDAAKLDVTRNDTISLARHLEEANAMSEKPTTKKSTARRLPRRKGAVAVLTAVLMIPLIGIVACAVDYGYLLKKRADLQRAADAAALAAVRDLVPDDDGNQDLALVKATLREYAAANVEDVPNFSVLDADIEIGRYDPATIYTNFTILNTGSFDTVRVRLRRDSTANSGVSLFFARIFGINESDVSVTATAVLPPGRNLTPSTGVLPFSIPKAQWDTTNAGDVWNVYADGRLEDDLGATIPGNWGTLDLGLQTNSTSDMSDQMLNGLRQYDLDGLYADGRIPSDTHIDSAVAFSSNGDTGLSSGMKAAVQAIHGEKRLIPIYDSVAGGGGNVEYHVVGWASVRVIDSSWNGSQNTHVQIKKAFLYDGYLTPPSDLSDTADFIEGAFASPVLVQ
jgi:hypothetical protein